MVPLNTNEGKGERMEKRSNFNMPVIDRAQALALHKRHIKDRKRIIELEKIFAREIQRVSDLLKENQKLAAELEKLKCNCDAWRKYYERKQGKKIPCNRNRAMVIHGEFTQSEATGQY